jgi:hypothetical protein
VFEYRITKYDPANRDSCGVYRREEWTSIKDIGRELDGQVLTEAEYRRVEEAYATIAVAFLREAGLSTLAVAGLENSAGRSLGFSNGTSLGLSEIADVVRRMLREEFWCRLEGDETFVHIGWDYYMYVGVPKLCDGATALANQLGLFVESFPSPYGDLRQTEKAQDAVDG